MKKSTLLSSFANAFNGISYFFMHERNGKIHIVAAIAVVIASFAFSVSAMEWCILLLCITQVLTAEMLNTAIEKLSDKAEPDFHPLIKIVKDVSAGAVLVASIISAVAGIIIFLPKILELL